MIVRMTGGFGKEPVFRRNLIERRRHERFHEQLGPESDAALHARHHRIEIVEGAECDLAYGAALRSIWIDVIKMLEAIRIFDIAEQRQRMLPVL